MESKQHKGLALTFLFLILTNTATSLVPAQDIDFTDPPITQTTKQAKPGFYKFLGDCIRKTTTYCGSQVVNYIFKNVEFDHAVCCPRIVAAGYICNCALTDNLADFDKFKPQPKAEITARGDAVFNQCVKHVGVGGAN